MKVRRGIRKVEFNNYVAYQIYLIGPFIEIHLLRGERVGFIFGIEVTWHHYGLRWNK